MCDGCSKVTSIKTGSRESTKNTYKFDDIDDLIIERRFIPSNNNLIVVNFI